MGWGKVFVAGVVMALAYLVTEKAWKHIFGCSGCR